MGLQNTLSWYQKKIGAYDKQQWETTIEQRILHGFTHVPKKSAKLKTELIDVDLVRGSAFTKAKPQQGFVTVTRLATLRLLFLPLYSKWWMRETSAGTYFLLLVLYWLQLVSLSLYCYAEYHDALGCVTPAEVLIPSVMMLALAFIHSQIVATADSLTPRQTWKKPRRPKRPKRRSSVRQRLKGSDSKSSADTGSEKAGSPIIKSDISDAKKKKSTLEEDSQKRTARFQRVRIRIDGEEENAVGGEAANVETVETNASGKEGDEKSSTEKYGAERARLLPAGIASRQLGDDDGFESLSGNNSSENGEETVVGALLKSQNLTKEEATDKKDSLPVVAPDSLPSVAESLRDRWFRDIRDLRKGLDRSGVSTGCEADRDTDPLPSDAEITEEECHGRRATTPQRLLARRQVAAQNLQVHISSRAESSYNSSCESEADELPSPSPVTEAEGSGGVEWIGVTTNSEECSYSSEPEESDTDRDRTELHEDPFAWEFQGSPSMIQSPSCASSDKVSCTVWEKGEVKKADLSVLDISSAIIARVETMPEEVDYLYGGLFLTTLFSFLPSFFRLCEGGEAPSVDSVLSSPLVIQAADIPTVRQSLTSSIASFTDIAFGDTILERTLVMVSQIERLFLGVLFVFVLAVAERTFKQRFLYSKLFSHLTSFRRARKSELPHFRLNKVRNIKSWLSVRSYLKKRGPQRSVDVIVSAAFIATLLLLSFLSMELLKTPLQDCESLRTLGNLEAVCWCLVLGVFLLRFMTLGTKLNRKYRNLSVLITEQINLYLQIEQKPHKKEELLVANSVLKLAADLLKELESPFKISGLSANPYLYTITKVVILSAVSGVLSEMLGFKLKLHKIKIK